MGNSPGIDAGNTFRAFVESHVNDGKRFVDHDHGDQVVRITGQEGKDIVQLFNDELAKLTTQAERAKFHNVAMTVISQYRNSQTAEGHKFEKMAYDLEDAFQASIGAGGVRLQSGDPKKAEFTPIDVRGITTSDDASELFKAALISHMSDELHWNDQGQEKQLVARDINRIKLLLSDLFSTLPQEQQAPFRDFATRQMQALVDQNVPDSAKLKQLIGVVESNFQAHVMHH